MALRNASCLSFILEAICSSRVTLYLSSVAGANANRRKAATWCAKTISKCLLRLCHHCKVGAAACARSFKQSRSEFWFADVAWWRLQARRCQQSVAGPGAKRGKKCHCECSRACQLRPGRLYCLPLLCPDCDVHMPHARPCQTRLQLLKCKLVNDFEEFLLPDGLSLII